MTGFKLENESLGAQLYNQHGLEFHRGGVPASSWKVRKGKKWKPYLVQVLLTDIVLLGSFNYLKGFPGGSDCKEFSYNVGDLGSIPGLGRSPGEGNGCPLQYSGLENSMNCMVHGVTKSRTRMSD